MFYTTLYKLWCHNKTHYCRSRNRLGAHAGSQISKYEISVDPGTVSAMGRVWNRHNCPYWYTLQYSAILSLPSSWMMDLCIFSLIIGHYWVPCWLMLDPIIPSHSQIHSSLACGITKNPQVDHPLCYLILLISILVATTAQVWDEALEGDWKIPAGKYLLVDAGLLCCDKLLVPYHSVQYHLAELDCASTRYFSLIFLFKSN